VIDGIRTASGTPGVAGVAGVAVADGGPADRDPATPAWSVVARGAGAVAWSRAGSLATLLLGGRPASLEGWATAGGDPVMPIGGGRCCAPPGSRRPSPGTTESSSSAISPASRTSVNSSPPFRIPRTTAPSVDDPLTELAF